MRQRFAFPVIAFCLALCACGGGDQPGVGESDRAGGAPCIPACPRPCRPVDGCAGGCVCPPPFTPCGATACNPGEQCCPGPGPSTANDFCLPKEQDCPPFV